MPANTHLAEAIKAQGQEISRRADWLKQMIDRSSQTILNCQDTISHFQVSLDATNMTLDYLREEYRKLLASTETNQDTISKE